MLLLARSSQDSSQDSSQGTSQGLDKKMRKLPLPMFLLLAKCSTTSKLNTPF